MRTTKTNQIAGRAPTQRKFNSKTRDWFSERMPRIARAYKRGVDSGHGDLRWFGADQVRIMAAGSKFAKFSQTNAAF
jgi:hypothetical protein